MGLDISHGGPHIGYIHFATFRKKLAEYEGIDLYSMQGYNLKDDRIPWKGVTSPLRPLLDHSDCDGSLMPSTCAKMAPYLHTVVQNIWVDVIDPDLSAQFFGQYGHQLADAMERAAAAGERLKFS